MLQFTCIGNIGGDAELHQENGNSYVSFKVAHNESFTKSDGSRVESTIWVSCILNGDGGGLLKYLVKGQLVFVSGDGDVRTYHSKVQRQMVAGVNIRVRQIQLLGSRPEAVPGNLINDDGVVFRVQKFYNVGKIKDKTLHDSAGVVYNIDENGWVSTAQPATEQQQEPTESTTGYDGY